MLLEQN